MPCIGRQILYHLSHLGSPYSWQEGGSLLCEKWALSPGLSSGAERQLRAEGLKGVGGELTDTELRAPRDDRVT